MTPTTVKTLPMIATSASGDKLIVFTPGEGIERRTEADIVRNEFGMYGLGCVEKSENYPGWLTFSFSVDRLGEEVLVVDVLMSDLEAQNPRVGKGRMFSRLAIAYNGGAHVIAVQSKYSKQWYYNTSASEIVGIF